MTQEQEEEETMAVRNPRLGVDVDFSERKHYYVLQFPWNFEEVINEYQHEYKSLPESNFWYKWIVNR